MWSLPPFYQTYVHTKQNTPYLLWAGRLEWLLGDHIDASPGESDISHCWFTLYVSNRFKKTIAMLIAQTAQIICCVRSLVPGRWLGGAWGRGYTLGYWRAPREKVGSGGRNEEIRKTRKWRNGKNVHRISLSKTADYGVVTAIYHPPLICYSLYALKGYVAT